MRVIVVVKMMRTKKEMSRIELSGKGCCYHPRTKVTMDGNHYT